MKGLDPKIYTHGIYINLECKPIRQPQISINLILRDTVKIELQKMLNMGFIYPVSENQWASPLVIVPKKEINGECV